MIDIENRDTESVVVPRGLLTRMHSFLHLREIVSIENLSDIRQGFDNELDEILGRKTGISDIVEQISSQQNNEEVHDEELHH